MIEIRAGDRRAAFHAGLAANVPASPYVTPMWSDLDRILDTKRNPFCRDGHGRLEVFTAHIDGRGCLGRPHGTSFAIASIGNVLSSSTTRLLLSCMAED
jgi:hypothetical protein